MSKRRALKRLSGIYDTVAKYYEEGMSIPKACAKLSISTTYYYQTCKKLGKLSIANNNNNNNNVNDNVNVEVNNNNNNINLNDNRNVEVNNNNNNLIDKVEDKMIVGGNISPEIKISNINISDANTNTNTNNPKPNEPTYDPTLKESIARHETNINNRRRKKSTTKPS